MDKIALLKRLLDPKKIAVIGASKSKEKVGGIVFRRLMDSRRRLFPVNPKESAIDGYKVSPDILALPRDIDLAVITVSAEKAVESVEQCIERGIPNYIIVAGGFGEVGAEGRGLEDRLKQLAKIHHINILGPNSLGIVLPDENIDTIFVEHGDKALDRKGKVACIVQSGSVGVEALGYASNTGYGMRAFVGLGNKCDLDELDFLYYFSQDEKTNCLGFYLENIKKGREFLTAARKTAREKPVVVLKAGMTHTAASAVSSHTGKLAGSDNVISGALKQFGIQRVYDDEEFCDATKVLSMLSGAPGNRVAVLTAAGGYGVMCTDFIEKKDARATLEMAKLSDDTKKRIKTATFPFTACENRMHWLESLGNKNPDEFDAKQLVSLYSIKVPQGRRLLPSDTLNTNDVNPPCVLKVCSSGIVFPMRISLLKTRQDLWGLNSLSESSGTRFWGMPSWSVQAVC